MRSAQISLISLCVSCVSLSLSLPPPRVMQQLTAPDGEGPAVIPVVQQCVLSLKARETAALSLKRIFEQHVQRNTGSSRTTLDDQHAAADMNLDLRLATPSSFCGISPDLIRRHGELPHLESLALLQNTEMDKVAVPLTIFYNGTVCLFKDISAEKVNAIMRLLEADSTGHGSFVDAPCRSRPRAPTSSFDITANSNTIKPRSRSQAELPFARKASLSRFLAKRKDRVETKDAEADMKSKEKPSDGPEKKICTKPQLLSSDLYIGGFVKDA